MSNVIRVLIAASAVIAAVPATHSIAAEVGFGPSNPFYAASTLPFQAPPFDRIRDEHYQPESRRLIEFTYDEFVHSGANLADADKAKLRKLNEEASTLSDTFTSKLLAATKEAAFHAQLPAALSGLSDAQVAAAAQAARSRAIDGYVLVLQNTTQPPVLESLQDRATRQTIYESSWGRTERGGARATR